MRAYVFDEALVSPNRNSASAIVTKIRAISVKNIIPDFLSMSIICAVSEFFTIIVRPFQQSI
jgi:hypothetical protein